MFQQCTAEIDLGQLVRNLAAIRKISKCDHVIVPVKANAYGHGLIPIARTLEKERVTFLAVAFASEGKILREHGVKSPILVLSGIEDPKDVLEFGLTPTLISLGCAKELAKAMGRSKRKLPVHLDIDTGMGRTGILAHEAVRVCEKIMELDRFQIEGIYTHLASSDDRKDKFTEEQISLFHQTLGRLRDLGITPKFIHCANSGGILNFRETWQRPFNAIRPGIMLYGCSPDNKPLEGTMIKPLLSLRSGVLYVKSVEPGTPIGYNRSYRARTREHIATLGIGYGDGLFRGLSNKGRVLARGDFAPVVGRVSMDLTTIRVRKGTLKPGDHVTLIGQENGKRITAEEMARTVGTIPYEIFCHLGTRVARKYKPA